MSRPVTRKPNTGERRWMLYELNRLANADGIVYERDLTAWWIGRLLHGKHVRRVEPGVLQVVKKP